MDHDEIRSSIPAWATGRLDPQERRRLEAHLAECAACDAAAATARTLALAIERDGAALFETHPDVDDLARYAQGKPSSRDRELGRHVASCASCSLELQAWQARRAAGTPAREKRKSWRETRFAAAGLAAGFLLGLLAMYLMRTPPERVAIASSSVPRVLLQSAVRGAAAEEPELTLSSTSAYGLLNVAFELPAQAVSTASVRFEIRDADGRTTWTSTEPVSTIAANLARHELVGFLVPTEALADGEHRLEVSIEHSGDHALVEAPFRVHRVESR